MSGDTEDCENAKHPGQAVESPFGRMMRHRHELDNVLMTIRGYTDESKLVRMFIVGQIEAMDVAIKFFEVG